MDYKGHIASVREYNPVSEIRKIFACEMACFSFFSLFTVLAGKWRHKIHSKIERRSVTSRYHGSKISGSQHFFLNTDSHLRCRTM